MGPSLPELEDLLRCPYCRGKLKWMPADQLAVLNDTIQHKQCLYMNGATVIAQIASAFTCEHNQFIFPIIDDIVCFLPAYTIVSNGQSWQLNNEKQVISELVGKFYDEFGWKRSDESDDFVDAKVFEDIRPVSADYIRNCHLRVNRYLSNGKYLLDAGSGPIQFNEYLSYSEQFEFRICADISFAALQQAQRKAGKQALYILADLTALPLADNSVDGVVSMHTIYHVHEDAQAQAINELYRVLKEDKSAVIVYTWGNHCTLMNLAHIPANLVRPLRALLNGPKDSAPALYFHPHQRSWFQSQKWPFEIDIFVWRSVSVTFLKTFAHNWLGGRQLLRCIYRIEEKFPKAAGRLGQYPLLLIRKSRRSAAE